jgi:AcrR family transcriptional regulator
MPGMARPLPPERLGEIVAAATAVFIAQGYRRTQMQDVADRLGLAKGTLYLYVESKEALFDLAVRHADGPPPQVEPAALPVRTPSPEATLAAVKDRLAQATALPVLRAAVARARAPRDVGGELEAVLRELWSMMESRRVGIKLADRCALDHPGLAALWAEAGRRVPLGLLERYLASRARRLRPIQDRAVAARQILETLSFWIVHRRWDRLPQRFEESRVEDTLVAMLRHGLTEDRS